MILQVDPGTFINTATPYSHTVYGVLVVCLAVACIALWKKLADEQKNNTDNLLKTTGVLHQLADYLKNEGAIEKLIMMHDLKIKGKLEEILNTIINNQNNNRDV